MASDDKILDELHFLSWKIETLERKLETSLAIQEDLAANLLLEDSSSMSTASALAIKKFDRRHISGSSCSEPISSDDEQNSPRFNGTRSKDLEREQERTYLIIPVGSYNDKDSFSFSAEKQTFTWSEMDDNACKYINSDDVLNSDKEIVNNLDANERRTNKPSNSNTPKSIAIQATPLSQSRFAASEKQMCTQWNGNDSEIIPLEDCLLNSRASHSVDCDYLEGQGKVGGAFDIDYDQDNKMVSTETKSSTSFSNCKYGLTIGIATTKGSSQGMFNDINSLRTLDTRYDKPADQHLEHSERFISHFETGGFKEQRPAGAQLGPFLKESMYSSDEVTFDQICNHSSKSMDCDTRLTEYKQTSSDFASDENTCSTRKGNNLPYKVTYVDSESSENDQTNCDFVDAYVQDSFSYEKNTGSLNANLGEQSSLANTAPDNKQVSLDYRLLVKNGKYEYDVYSTQKMESFQKGNHRFKQMGTDCDAANKRRIEMQIHRVPEEQRYEDAYYNHKQFDAENSLAHNGNGQSEGKQRQTQTHDIAGKVNSNGETSMIVLYRANGTKPPLQEADSQISHFGDRVYRVGGIDSNYEAINTDSIDTARSKSTPEDPCREKTIQTPDVATRGPHTYSTEDEFQTSHIRSQNFLDERALYNGTQSNFRFDGDALTESGFSETVMSALSDDVFFAATPNLNSETKTLLNGPNLVDHTAKFETSESESPYSSLTSVSSNNEVIHPWKPRKDSVSRHYGYDDRKHVISPNNGGAPRERNHQRTSASLCIGDNDSSPDSETPVPSFRLSPLPRAVRAPSLQEHLLSDIITRDFTAGPMRISSPASSVGTSELSVSDSICECQYQCECQTGIPSAEDFREELKAISTYVLNARKESASSYTKPRARYFLDEEQGDMEIFDGRLQKKENKAVPILVRVILRLRKHFFGSLESKTPYNSKTRGDPNNNDIDSLDQSDGQTSNGKQRKISFCPSAVLLSAIGENSAAEIKEVIEKENIDVNQLSPSGRSLLHKAAAAGDLESIYTLVQYGAFVNIQDQDGFPPIHSALRKAHFKCAILLIECGTDMVRYTTERVREFLEIKHMTTRHMPVLLKTNL